MGRGKVEIKRIENNISRQVTFSKRRAGLLKKARELSVLCDAEIAVIIFSSRGRIYPFSSLGEAPNAIEATIERYYRSTVNGAPREEPQPMHYCQELAALRAQYEHLKQAHRQLLGEDLVGLSVKQLELLEKQLESALDRTRHTKERQLGELTMKLKIEEGVEAAGVQLRMMNEYQQQQHQLQLHLQPPHHLHLHPGGAAGGWSFGGSSSSFDATAASQIGCYKPEPILEIGQPYFSSLPNEEHQGPSNPTSISHPDFHGWFH